MIRDEEFEIMVGCCDPAMDRVELLATTAVKTMDAASARKTAARAVASGRRPRPRRGHAAPAAPPRR